VDAYREEWAYMEDKEPGSSAVAREGGLWGWSGLLAVRLEWMGVAEIEVVEDVDCVVTLGEFMRNNEGDDSWSGSALRGLALRA
jgi:hypothetical protein